MPTEDEILSGMGWAAAIVAVASAIVTAAVILAAVWWLR